MDWSSKRIAIGVTGGIAAYKTCELIREFKKRGAEVRVGLTDAAQQFVSELTFASLSENNVFTSLFNGADSNGIAHIELARWCDVLIICPATANIIGKMANGIADDVVSTTFMATNADVIICPAMNSVMWQSRIVQQNLERLRTNGCLIVEPAYGELATSSEGEGWGRLAGLETIVQITRKALFGEEVLTGKKILVSAGPTIEPLDPVRFISNRSTGKMGYALAKAALILGGDVILVTGPSNLPDICGVKTIRVETTMEMKNSLETEYDDADILIMAAAVADFKPVKIVEQKIKKDSAVSELSLEKTSDILTELSARKSGCFNVGFALETENGLENAKAKLKNKNLDMIVLNRQTQNGAGFGEDTNIVTLISRDGKVQDVPKMSKLEVAFQILKAIIRTQKSNA